MDVLIQSRLKNGQPAVIIPSDTTINEIDPFLVFHSGNSNTPRFVYWLFKSDTGTSLNSS